MQSDVALVRLSHLSRWRPISVCCHHSPTDLNDEEPASYWGRFARFERDGKRI
jgi:hypothetical protein